MAWCADRNHDRAACASHELVLVADLRDPYGTPARVGRCLWPSASGHSGSVGVHMHGLKFVVLLDVWPHADEGFDPRGELRHDVWRPRHQPKGCADPCGADVPMDAARQRVPHLRGKTPGVSCRRRTAGSEHGSRRSGGRGWAHHLPNNSSTRLPGEHGCPAVAALPAVVALTRLPGKLGCPAVAALPAVGALRNFLPASTLARWPPSRAATKGKGRGRTIRGPD